LNKQSREEWKHLNISTHRSQALQAISPVESTNRRSSHGTGWLIEVHGKSR